MYETAAEPPSFQNQVVSLPRKDASPVLTEIRKDIKVWCMQLCYRLFLINRDIKRLKVMFKTLTVVFYQV